jgi:capsular exopolysaccharide synthesis family protein
MTKPDLVLLNDSRSAPAEAIRTLRTNLMFGQKNAQKPLHTFIITSAMDGDGKSVLAANLAVAFAQAGQKTILVDGDLRRPTQHTLWGVANDKGLMSMVNDEGAFANPPLLNTGVENLSLLTTGNSSDIPADVLSHPRMSEIIGVLKARADFVIFDASPVLVATDATLLGRKTDGALLVVRAGGTRKDHVSRAKSALEQVGAVLLGAVLTNANQEKTGKY